MRRVLILSASDSKGGAARVARDLVEGLAERGWPAELHARTCADPRPPMVQALPAGSSPTRFHTILRKLAHRLGVDALGLHASFPFSLGRAWFERFDLIHLHDLPPGFNLAALPWLARIRPLVWTLHTMAHFTGNCFYSYDCGRHRQSCGRCPQFGQWPLHYLHRDGSRFVNLGRRALFAATGVTPVAVSSWLANEARRGMLARHPVVTIQNSVDTRAFTPGEKAAAKAALGIDPRRFTIFFAVAGNLLDRRKGLDTILAALPLLSANKPFLLPTAVTEPAPEFQRILARFDGLPPRHLHGAAELAAYYRAADVIWHPTLADTSSIVSLEAMACGTPVIAAAVGGVPEIVRDQINGFLIPPGDPAALAASTERLMRDPALLARLAAATRPFVEKSFNRTRFIDQHIALYEELLR